MDFGLDFSVEQAVFMDSDTNNERRTQAALNLTELDPSRAQEVFCDFIKSCIAEPYLNPFIELVCVLQLGKVGSQNSVPVLTALSKANPLDPFVESHVSNALAEIAARGGSAVREVLPAVYPYRSVCCVS